MTLEGFFLTKVTKKSFKRPGDMWLRNGRVLCTANFYRSSLDPFHLIFSTLGLANNQRLIQRRCQTSLMSSLLQHSGTSGFRHLFSLNISRLFFVRYPSQSLQRKCGTRQFWRFENEFQLFENEFHNFLGTTFFFF